MAAAAVQLLKDGRGGAHEPGGLPGQRLAAPRRRDTKAEAALIRNHRVDPGIRQELLHERLLPRRGAQGALVEEMPPTSEVHLVHFHRES